MEISFGFNTALRFVNCVRNLRVVSRYATKLRVVSRYVTKVGVI